MAWQGRLCARARGGANYATPRRPRTLSDRGDGRFVCFCFYFFDPSSRPRAVSRSTPSTHPETKSPSVASDRRPLVREGRKEGRKGGRGQWAYLVSRDCNVARPYGLPHRRPPRAKGGRRADARSLVAAAAAAAWRAGWWEGGAWLATDAKLEP